jgi:hypothetical protein
MWLAPLEERIAKYSRRVLAELPLFDEEPVTVPPAGDCGAASKDETPVVRYKEIPWDTA